MYFQILKMLLKNLFFGLIFAILFLLVIKGLNNLSHTDLLIFLIISLIGLFAAFSVSGQRENELHKMHSCKKEQYDKLYAEYEKLKKQSEK